MKGGETWNVRCPNALRLKRTGPKAVTLICASNTSPTATTTVAPTTTTAAPTATTVRPTTTTVRPTTTTAAPTTTVAPTTTTVAPASGSVAGVAGCGLSQVAFCDPFDAPAGTGNRSGGLNGTVWGVSRVTGNQNFSSPANGWSSTQLTACGTTTTVRAPNDVAVCGGQLHDSMTDGGTVAALAMYPKQPFDFAGRTGTIVFDVSNDSQGNHAAWPELWMSDKPVPDPFTHEATFTAVPQNGFGVRFAGCTDSTGAGATCARGAGTIGVDSAIVVNNYVSNDSFNGGALKVTGHDSVMESQPGQLNHYEVRVSQNQIDVYGTDAFSGPLNLSQTPLRYLATIANANLSLTRGLVWIEDAHYNANKFTNQGTHTFTWDNVGFDGPVLPRDLAFDVADNTANGNDLGYFVPANSSQNLTATGVYNVSNAAAALLTFAFYEQSAPFTISYAINGHAHSLAWPYPDTLIDTPRTLAIPLSLSEVQNGNNVITFSTGNYGLTVMNIDLIMVAAGGTVSP
jgi:hypothetical protein